MPYLVTLLRTEALLVLFLKKWCRFYAVSKRQRAYLLPGHTAPNLNKVIALFTRVFNGKTLKQCWMWRRMARSHLKHCHIVMPTKSDQLNKFQYLISYTRRTHACHRTSCAQTAPSLAESCSACTCAWVHCLTSVIMVGNVRDLRSNAL